MNIKETSGLKDPLNLLGNNKILARFENNDIGICPVCHQHMKTLEADGIPSYVCLTDRICLPREDDSCLS